MPCEFCPHCEEQEIKSKETKKEFVTAADERPNSKAEEAIRAFRGQPEMMQVTYRDRTPNPYGDDDDDLIDIFVDQDGYEYWCHAGTGALMQMGPHADTHTIALQTIPENPKTVDQLRDIANAVASSIYPDWQEKKAKYDVLEDNRRGRVFFFRWDNGRAVYSEMEMPPFLQVALYADGTVAAFTDTLR